jgi:hypothetical protein
MSDSARGRSVKSYSATRGRTAAARASASSSIPSARVLAVTLRSCFS